MREEFNCLPEYYRQQEERECREYERELRRRDGYEADRKILEDAEAKGLLIMAEAFDCPDACWNCKTRSKSLQTWEDDDISRFVCYGEKCKHRREI